jgi:alpha-L-fucosidase 2
MVYENLKKLITHSTNPNLINKEPSFRVDGNFGGTAAITEALMQSTAGTITILPALPEEWSEGSVKGLRGKGGFEIAMSWKKGRLEKAEVISLCGGVCRLRVNGAASVICDGTAVNSRIEDGAIVFDTVEGETYTITA